MTIILTNVTLPERGQVAINLSFEIKVTAEEAKRKVTWWLREEVSMLIYGETPTLVVGERPVWRVPAWIAFPSTGPLGEVGTAEVNADTGEMLNPEGFRAEVERRLETEIRPKMPKDRKKMELPPDYIAKLDPPPSLLQKQE